MGAYVIVWLSHCSCSLFSQISLVSHTNKYSHSEEHWWLRCCSQTGENRSQPSPQPSTAGVSPGVMTEKHREMLTINILHVVYRFRNGVNISLSHTMKTKETTKTTDRSKYPDVFHLYQQKVVVACVLCHYYSGGSSFQTLRTKGQINKLNKSYFVLYFLRWCVCLLLSTRTTTAYS